MFIQTPPDAHLSRIVFNAQISIHRRNTSVTLTCSKVQPTYNFWMDHMDAPFLQSCNFANVWWTLYTWQRFASKGILEVRDVFMYSGWGNCSCYL